MLDAPPRRITRLIGHCAGHLFFVTSFGLRSLVIDTITAGAKSMPVPQRRVLASSRCGPILRWLLSQAVKSLQRLVISRFAFTVVLAVLCAMPSFVACRRDGIAVK